MSDEPEYRPLSVRLPADLHAQLRASAAAHERSWGGEVRAIVKAHLAEAVPDSNGASR
jgi:plasmid stability protein